MERDHKYSGTLPLLAYAPQDFGLNAQRARAYRASAAMGRTGVQPLRSHAQAPVALNKTPDIIKNQIKSQPEKPLSMFGKLRLLIAGLFHPSAKITEVKQASVQPEPVRVENTNSDHGKLNREIAAQQNEADRTIKVSAAQIEPVFAAEMQTHVQPQPVSKTYAAMRMKNTLLNDDDHEIPQAPDLAHALAEIRLALREHERLAKAQQSGNLSH